jgi:hypothetical protein
MPEPTTTIAYEVHYQEADRPDWFIMTGRDHNEHYRHPSDSPSAHETTSLDEATDTAEALVAHRAFPHDPKSPYYRRVVAARVITRVYTGAVSAVYGTPHPEKES